MEMRGGKLSREDLLLLDSVFIITAAVHRGNLAGYIKGSFTAHLYHLTHTSMHTGIHTLMEGHTYLLIQRAKDIETL